MTRQERLELAELTMRHARAKSRIYYSGYAVGYPLMLSALVDAPWNVICAGWVIFLLSAVVHLYAISIMRKAIKILEGD
jgi:hypothetical protein